MEQKKKIMMKRRRLRWSRRENKMKRRSAEVEQKKKIMMKRRRLRWSRRRK